MKDRSRSNGTQLQRQEAKQKIDDDDAFLEEQMKIVATEKRALEAEAVAIVVDEQRQDLIKDAATEKRALEAKAAAVMIDEQRQDLINDALGLCQPVPIDFVTREARDDEADGKCMHGFQSSSGTQSALCASFIRTFYKAHFEAASDEDGFALGIRATEEKQPEVWNDRTCVHMIIEFCRYSGTQLILDGDYNTSRLLATLSRYLEEVIAVSDSVQNDIYWTKVFELYGADDHTLVKYFRRRIPCSCLDKKYKEVKHVTKLGICYNPNCPLPERKIERSKLMHCTRCRQANYCSVACQNAAWKSHKRTCVEWSSKKKTGTEYVPQKNRFHEGINLTEISKALEQEWSEKGEKSCKIVW